jgi:hypothetical protein
MTTGTVKDSRTGESLPRANVYFSDGTGRITPANLGTATDSRGSYRLDTPGPGFITASYTGYQSLTRPCGLMGGPLEMINFNLVPAENALPEVEITASKTTPWQKILTGAAIVGGAVMLAWYLRTHN